MMLSPALRVTAVVIVSVVLHGYTVHGDPGTDPSHPTPGATDTGNPSPRADTHRQRSDPPFSWRTVPVFAETSNVTGVFDAEALATLAKFPFFVAEKAYDFDAPGFAEDKLATLATKLKALNPEIFLVFYYNANLDLTDYRLYNLTAQHAPFWWLRNDQGKVLIAPIDSGAGATPPFPYNAHGGGVPAYNFSFPELRDAWVQECFDMTSSGYDGCMVDRWIRTPFKGQKGFSPAVQAQFVADRNLATAALAARAKAAGTYLVGEGPDVAALSFPGYGPTGAKALQAQLAAAASGLGMLASYTPKSTGASFATQLAKFLVGMGHGHYFGAGSWTVGDGYREGVTWHPEYDLPLGAPLSNAVLNGTVYTRKFAYATEATYDTATNVGTIKWGTFPPKSRTPT
eukprot:m.132461 g.132461  ORF g.132461 m.132461 type:complete len:400 (-) comp22449_c0_seq1:22-1221(-)